MTLLRKGPRMLCSTAIFLAVLMGPALAPAKDGPVQVHILVIEASKKNAGFDKRVEEAKVVGQIKSAGYVGAKVLDALEAKVEADAQVSLQIRDQPDKSRTLTVKVLDVKEDVIKLRVAIPEFKFSTDTTHTKSGTILLAFHSRGPDDALFLAVTPKP